MTTGLTITLPDLQATITLGSNIANALTPGTCIYINGELGVGKTTLVRAILQALGVTGHIKSPTFALVEEYECEKFQLYHFDLYRLNDAAELENLGIRDYASSDAVLIFEWAEKGGTQIPAADLQIDMHLGADGRYAILSGRIPYEG
jgi:tRNA threonylcarbamoyladenosine biosynthesis protein TsaE